MSATTDTTTDPTTRDRLFFQQHRAHVDAAYAGLVATAGLSAELRRRLEDLDELAESIDFEKSGAPVQHHYSGKPVPFLQQRVGEHVQAVRTAAERLRVAAEDLQEAATDAGDLPRLAHVARGHLALVAEAMRVVDTHRPWCELAQVDWRRVDAITDGIDRLIDMDGGELQEDVAHLLEDHDRQQHDRRAAGLGQLADRVDSEPGGQRALAAMRRYVGDAGR